MGKFPSPPQVQVQSLFHPSHVSHPADFWYLKRIVSPIKIDVCGFESYTTSYKAWQTSSAKSGTHIYVPRKSQVLTARFFLVEIFFCMKHLGEIQTQMCSLSISYCYFTLIGKSELSLSSNYSQFCSVNAKHEIDVIAVADRRFMLFLCQCECNGTNTWQFGTQTRFLQILLFLYSSMSSIEQLSTTRHPELSKCIQKILCSRIITSFHVIFTILQTRKCTVNKWINIICETRKKPSSSPTEDSFRHLPILIKDAIYRGSFVAKARTLNLLLPPV